MKQILYFGCLREVGHFLYAKKCPYSIYNAKTLEKHTGITNAPEEIFGSIDGRYTPTSTKNQGDAREVTKSNVKMIAWHDYTVDSRGNSNSALIGFGYESREEMLADAKIEFPSVMERQPGPLNFIDE